MGEKTVIGFGLVINMMLVGSEVHGITCNEAITYLLPCEPFLLGLGPKAPPPICCTNIKTIFSETKTVKVRRSICNCLKEAVIKAGIKHERASHLPQFCSTQFSFLIDPHFDCDS